MRWLTPFTPDRPAKSFFAKRLPGCRSEVFFSSPYISISRNWYFVKYLYYLIHYFYETKLYFLKKNLCADISSILSQEVWS